MADPASHGTPTGTLTAFPARAIYRALLVRGLEPGEAANLTAYLAGLPTTGVHWTIPEVEAIVRRRSQALETATTDPDDGPGPVQLTWQLS
ncbi:MAG TPA: hypothetical protein VGI98_07490 [Candidatus Limnocylindrales bacterium]